NSSTPFRGNLEGNGHTIDNMVIDSANMDFAGLFGCIDSATVSGLELGVHSRVRGRSYVGGITGCARNSSNIQQCANHAPVTGSEEYIGGICGYMSQSTIRECYNAADIRGKDKVGGIVGYAGTASASGGSSALGTSNVSYCYNSHAVRGSQCTGGLIGFANGNTTLSRSYNSGQLFGAHYTGSIIGRKYSSHTSISECVYDRQTSRFAGINGKDPETSTEGRTTLQMTGTLLQQLLDTLHWRYMESCYPQLQAMEQSPAAWVSVIPIFLSGNETTDSVAHDFMLGERPGFIWESADPSVLRIEGFKATLLDSDTLSIIVRFDSVISKKYDIHTYPEVTHIASIENNREKMCRIYPNPVTRQLHICTQEASPFPLQQVSLTDATGRIVMRKEVNGKLCELDLQNLPTGTYQLRVTDSANRMYRFTIVKKQ
ncbi:MAG: T9SS type A sorting domain-containing protein, partial [Bacteroidales bacterium]|nr:T9SS type A sorting domain-containing protein [Bacteroidales bacterium]